MTVEGNDNPVHMAASGAGLEQPVGQRHCPQSQELEGGPASPFMTRSVEARIAPSIPTVA